jgi:hypothetical protein
VPSGCCGQNAAGQTTIVDASCINGTWVCPPGTASFGSGSCHPPLACAPTLPCAIGQYCVFADDKCGTTGLAGSCKPVPGGCSGGGPAVCGCDGQVHGSTCAAALEGVDLSSNQSCNAPSGTFACGAYFCGVSGQICEDDRNFANPVPDVYSCIAPPAGCPSGCGCNACPPCPAGHMCKEVCTTDSSGGHHLTCNVM